MAAVNLGSTGLRSSGQASTGQASSGLGIGAARQRGRFHSLEVAEVRPLTAESVEVTFAVPEELQGDFGYGAGQHLALRATIEGHELRRSYSICRPPTPGSIAVAIKRDLGGRFSTWPKEAPCSGWPTGGRPAVLVLVLVTQPSWRTRAAVAPTA